MSDCVWEAIKAAISVQTASFPQSGSARIYFLIKLSSHGTKPANTFGGLVPFIADCIATLNGLYTVKQHVLIGKKEYLDMAEGEYQRHYTQLGDFGEFVDKITVAPAVYCMYKWKHAIYSNTVPPGLCLMAVKFVDRLEKI